MNEPQRMVLQSQMRTIANNIIMSEDFLSSLCEKNIFESHMIEIIREEKTSIEKTLKMLQLLQKRGPDAFDSFIDVIQGDYPWLATSLQSKYRSQMELYTSRIELTNQKTVTEVQQNDGKKVETENVGSDIRKKVSTFVHKCFGHSKKLAEKEKKLIVNWMTDQITDERTRLQSTTTSEHSHIDKETEDGEIYKLSQIKKELFTLHLKLEPFLFHDETDDAGLNTYIPDDMTFTLLRDEIDRLCEMLSNIQDEIDSTLDQFDSCVRNHSIKTLVEGLVINYNKQSEQLDEEGKKNTILINDLSEYSEQIHKLETDSVKMRYQIDLMHKDLSIFRHEKFQAQAHRKLLESLNNGKDKTIETMTNRIEELQMSKTKKNTIRSETSGSPVRKSRSVARAVNTTLFSRKSTQYYTTQTSISQKKKS